MVKPMDNLVGSVHSSRMASSTSIMVCLQTYSMRVCMCEVCFTDTFPSIYVGSYSHVHIHMYAAG